MTARDAFAYGWLIVSTLLIAYMLATWLTEVPA